MRVAIRYYARMDLSDLYRTEGISGLSKLAEAAKTDPKYLYHCATGRRTPSPSLARRLVQADSRLTLDDIYAEKVR